MHVWKGFATSLGISSEAEQELVRSHVPKRRLRTCPKFDISSGKHQQVAHDGNDHTCVVQSLQLLLYSQDQGNLAVAFPVVLIH